MKFKNVVINSKREIVVLAILLFAALLWFSFFKDNYLHFIGHCMDAFCFSKVVYVANSKSIKSVIKAANSNNFFGKKIGVLKDSYDKKIIEQLSCNRMGNTSC